MPQHRTCSEEFGCIPEDAAIRIANLRYDELADFFHQLARKIASDAAADAERGRPFLSQRLTNLAQYMENAAEEMDKVWETCKRYMQE